MSFSKNDRVLFLTTNNELKLRTPDEIKTLAIDNSITVEKIRLFKTFSNLSLDFYYISMYYTSDGDAYMLDSSLAPL